MKSAFTDVDREAARLFKATGGMLAGWPGWKNGVRPFWERLKDGTEATPDALDTDDPATAGAMVAQLEHSGRAVSIADRRVSLPGDDARRFLVLVDLPDGGQVTATGPTRGAALVAVAGILR